MPVLYGSKSRLLTSLDCDDKYLVEKSSSAWLVIATNTSRLVLSILKKQHLWITSDSPQRRTGSIRDASRLRLLSEQCVRSVVREGGDASLTGYIRGSYGLHTTTHQLMLLQINSHYSISNLRANPPHWDLSSASI